MLFEALSEQLPGSLLKQSSTPVWQRNLATKLRLATKLEDGASVLFLGSATEDPERKPAVRASAPR
jgi:hypothetical protein